MLSEKRDSDGILYIYDRELKDGAQDRRFIKILVAPNLNYMGNDCFYNCPDIEKVIAPYLKKVGEGCFDECPKLREVVAPYLKLNGICFLGSLFIDLKEKKILNEGIFNHKFAKIIEAEIQNESSLSLEERDGARILKSGDFEILKEEAGVITGVCLPTAKVFPAHSLYENPHVKELVLLSAEQIDHNAICKSGAIEKVVAPKLVAVRFSNFVKCPRLKEVYAPKLLSLEHSCFNNNEALEGFSFPNLESVDRNSFCHLSSLKEFYAPKVIAIGESSLQYNKNMKMVVLPNLIEMERGMLYRSGVEALYAPKIHNRSQSIKYLKNAKHLIKNKAVLPLNYKNRIKDERQNV